MQADAAALRFRPQLWPTLVAAGAFAVLLGLGTWQVERLHWKEELIAERTAQLAAPPEPLPAQSDDWRAWDFRRVTVAGEFRHELEQLFGVACDRGSGRARRPHPSGAARRRRRPGGSRLGAGGPGASGRAPPGPARGRGRDQRHRALSRRGPARLVHARQPARAAALVQLRPPGDGGGGRDGAAARGGRGRCHAQSGRPAESAAGPTSTCPTTTCSTRSPGMASPPRCSRSTSRSAWSGARGDERAAPGRGRRASRSPSA